MHCDGLESAKKYAAEEVRKAFRNNPNRAAVCWISSRHVQALDSFQWVEEKQRHGDHDLPIFGIVRVPAKDQGALLDASGQEGVFVEDAVRMRRRSRSSGLTESETDKQYFARAVPQGAAFGLAVHGGRTGC